MKEHFGHAGYRRNRNFAPWFCNCSYVSIPKCCSIVCIGLVVLGNLLLSPTPAHAQSLEQITVPAEISMGTLNPSRKGRVSSALTELEYQFTRSPESFQNNDVGAEMGVTISFGTVTIEAIPIPTSSAEDLLRDLKDIGLVRGTFFGNLVSGQFPLAALSTARVLPTLKFIRLARPIKQVGSADNQADLAMQSNLARQDFGVDGTGVAIGIMSDSYNQLSGAAADTSSGDLPTSVQVIDDSAFGFGTPEATSGAIDEGRAMAQLIHDIAPGAGLLFHTAFNGQADFAQGILDLADAGANIIVDDVGNLLAPMFQDGLVAQAVDTVVADGVVYFSSAGNQANSSYEATYANSGESLTLTGLEEGDVVLTNLHEFAPGDTIQEFLIPDGDSIVLSFQWDDPFASVSTGGAGAATDIDILLVNDGFQAVAGSFDPNIGLDAAEPLFYTNTTGQDQLVGLIIGIRQGPVPGRIKWINFASDVATTPAANSSTIFAHPNANGAIAVGAVRYDQTPIFGVTPPVLEPFSSYGGLEVLFDTAGNRLEAPQNRNKPEITAADGVDTTFFGGSDFDGTGFPNFFGTSAAAPNAAAAAALLLQCSSTTLSPAEVEALLTDTAIDMLAPGYDVLSGNGFVDALSAANSACASTLPAVSHFAFLALTSTNAGAFPVSGSCSPIGSSLSVSATNGVLTTPESGTSCVDGNTGGEFTVLLDLSPFAVGDIAITSTLTDAEGGTGSDSDTVTKSVAASLCNGSAVTLIWGAGVTATSGNDVIWGTDNADTINARGGDDTVCGLGGNDTINGGNGVDVILGGEGNDRIGGQGGNDRLEGEAGNDVLNGGPGNDELFGGEGEDDLRGQSGGDTLEGGDGVDQFFGGSGNDIITTGPGGNLGTGKVVRGQGNDDTITGSSEADNLEGGPGLDQISGGDGDDLLRGGNAADTLRGEAGADTLEGGASNDELRGGSGDDNLLGGTGDDDLFGEGGDDTLDGQGGIDDCDGGTTDEVLGDSATASCETLIDI